MKEACQKWLEPDGRLRLEGWARDGLTDEQLARKMGVSPDTLSSWREQHPALSQAVDRGREMADLQVESALLKRALGYEYMEERVEISEKTGRKVIQTNKTVPPDTTAQMFWLKNRRPERWREKPQESGPGPEAGGAASMTLAEKLAVLRAAAQSLDGP